MPFYLNLVEMKTFFFTVNFVVCTYFLILPPRYLLIPLGVHTSARLNSSDILYDPLPLHHTAGGVLGAGQCLTQGCTVVLKKKFSARSYWKDAVKHGCTVSID